MSSTTNKDQILTTGDIAKYCNVHSRTVIRWIENGSLKAYKLPGRGNNRVEADEFVRFLKAHNMPIPDQFQQNNTRILIVDDEREMAASINRALTRAGYQTCIAKDGFQAGALLASFQPHLMTLDLNMPLLNGFEVLSFIDKQTQYRDLKVVVVSALDETSLKQAINAGANQYLPKPFKKEALLSIVESLIGKPQK